MSNQSVSYNYTVTATPVGDSPTGGQPFSINFTFYTDDAAKLKQVTDFVDLLRSSDAIVAGSVSCQRLDAVQTSYDTDMTTDPISFT